MKIRNRTVCIGLLVMIQIFRFSAFAQEKVRTDSKGTAIPDAFLNRITMDLNHIPLLDAFSEIMKAGNVYLNYNEEIIPINLKVSVHRENSPVIDILEEVLHQTDLDYVVSISGQIVIVKAKFTVAVEKFTLSGYVTDLNSGEVLIGTNVYIHKLRTGCVTNVYGFYSLTVPADSYAIRYSYMGYETKNVTINLNQDMKMNIELEEKAITGGTVTITAEIEDWNVKSTEMGTIRMNPKELIAKPVLLGEQDIFRTLQFLPGISATREGSSGFHVRGGNSDQNLVLIDEAPVYNAFHLLGFFSVFNSDAIKDVLLVKGATPPKYGGRLSSVLDVQMNEGNFKNFHGNGGIGLIFSRLSLQGPIVKNRGSFILSGRRTYADLFLFLSPDQEIQNSRLYFYDLNLKANYRLSDRDRIYLSAYLGRDAMGVDQAVDMYWGNKTATLRWNHLYNNKLFSNTSLIYSNFTYTTDVSDENDDQDDEVYVRSVVNDLTVKEDFQYFVNSRNTLNFGMNYVYHTFLPGEFSIKDESDGTDFSMNIGQRHAHETAFYLSHRWDLLNSLKLDYGFRFSMFYVVGKGDQFDYSQFGDIPTDVMEIELHAKENKCYKGLEPRFLATLLLNKTSSLKFGFSRNYQHMHLISNTTTGTPLDVWQPSSGRVSPQCADQVSLGYFKNLNDNRYEMSIEVFYKDFQNQIDFKNGANLFLSSFFESELVFGNGWAYGAEFFLRKKIGKLSGWISYTLSKTERKFKEINNGKPFPAKYDRPHDFSIVCEYQLSDKVTLSANWVYYSGNAITVPYGRYSIDGEPVTLYSERNAYRMPAYHRLDLNLSVSNSKGGVWNFSLYNAYGRKNTYSIGYEDHYGNDVFTPEYTDAVRIALFTFVPSVSYSFKF